MLAKSIINNHMSASKNMCKKIEILIKKYIAPRDELVAEMFWNLRVQVSIHDNIHSTSALVLARFWQWLNFFKFFYALRKFEMAIGYRFLFV